MKIIRSFEPGDRYRYDFDLCTCARGWAQVDTAQDASWFGTWASPAERTILNFAEGDVTRTVCDTDEEFVAALLEIDRWNRDHGYGPARIDPGSVRRLRRRSRRLGWGICCTEVQQGYHPIDSRSVLWLFGFRRKGNLR